MATSFIRSKKYTVNSSVDKILELPDVATYLMNVPAATTGAVYICMENNILATPTTFGSVTFADNNPSADTVTRVTGSWIMDKFVVGMTLNVFGTTTNNGTYTITTVTEKVITISGAFTNETVAAPAIVGIYDDASVWFLWNTTVGAGIKFEAIEYGPRGLRFKRTAGTGSLEIWVKS